MSNRRKTTTTQAARVQAAIAVEQVTAADIIPSTYRYEGLAEDAQGITGEHLQARDDVRLAVAYMGTREAADAIQICRELGVPRRWIEAAIERGMILRAQAITI